MRNAFDIIPAIKVIAIDYKRNAINAEAKRVIQGNINLRARNSNANSIEDNSEAGARNRNASLMQ